MCVCVHVCVYMCEESVCVSIFMCLKDLTVILLVAIIMFLVMMTL